MTSRVSGIAVVISLAVFAIAYLASPLILGRALSGYLDGLGVEARLQFDRPTLTGIMLSKGYIAAESWTMEVAEARFDFSLRSLRQARVDLLEVRGISIRSIPASAEVIAVESYPPVSLWQALPVNNLTIHQIEIQVAEPELVSTASVRMTRDQLAVSMTAQSPLLPAPLFADVTLDPAGTFLAIVGPDGDVEGDKRVLRIEGAKVDDHLVLAGDLTIDAGVFDLLSRSLGLQDLSGSISGQLAGKLAWPVTPEAFSSFVLNGLLEINVGLEAPGYNGSDIEGSIAFELRDEQLQVSSKDLFLGSADKTKPFRLKGIDYSFSPGSEFTIGFESAPFNLRTQSIDELVLALTIKTGLVFVGDPINMSPDLSVTNLGINSMLDVFLTPTGVRVSLGEMRLTGSSAIIDGVNYTMGGESLGLLSGEFQLPSIQAMIESPETLVSLQGEIEGAWQFDFVADAADAATGRITINANTSMVQENGAVRLSVAKGGELGVLQSGQRYNFLLTTRANAEFSADGSMKLSETELLVRVPELTDPILVHLASVDKVGDSINTTGWVRLRDNPAALVIKMELTLGLSTLQGSVRLFAEHRVNKTFLNREIPGWVSQYDLTRGNLSFEAQGLFSVGGDNPEYDIEGWSELKDGAGYYEDIPLKGVAFSLPVVIADSGLTLGPGPVSIETADPGLPVRNVRMSIDATDDHVRAVDLEGQVLGGSFNIRSLDYDLVADASDFVIRLDGISLSDVLALEGDDLSGDGVLDAELRVIVGPDGLRVSEGRVQSRAPGGYIRYLGPASDGGNAGLKLALTALKNFQYESLQATPSYENGNLTLGIRLEGKNEEVESGRPIHFNLNINENIPALLQSLHTHEKLERKIQDRATGGKSLAQ
jgi:hypothetical protein